MTKMARFSAAAAALTMLAGLTLAGSAFAQSPTADEKVILRVGVDSDITSLNPFNVCCGPDYEYLSLVYDQPMTFATKDLSPAPALVTEWTPSEDYMTWTLKVRDDAVWHDGQPVTAEDVAFTLGFIADFGMPFFKDYVPFSPLEVDGTHLRPEHPALPAHPAEAHLGAVHDRQR